MKSIRCLSLLILMVGLTMGAMAQTAAAPAPAAAAPAPAVSASAAELKDAASKAPAAADLAKGDPGGTITGTINDVPPADSKAGVTLPDVANQVGQNKVAINFVWTLNVENSVDQRASSAPSRRRTSPFLETIDAAVPAGHI